MDPNTQRLLFGAAGAAGGDSKTYIEDLFSTYVYQGTGSSQTINNGIDLTGKGGLVWIKARSSAEIHGLYDTARGANKFLYTNGTAAQVTRSEALTAFTSTGFSLGVDGNFEVNTSGTNYVSWTFRKAAKFFDVVTYTGDGSASLGVSHNLGSVPGAIIVKCTSTGGTSWKVYHRSLGRSIDLSLNTTEQAYTTTNFWGSSDPTSTQFYVGSAGATSLNGSGATYVAYLFAHDTTADGMIQCGSYTGNGSNSGPQVTLGWEPQWVMLKRTSGAGGWYIYDNMRGVTTGGVDSNLRADSSGAESSSFDYLDFNASGFKLTTSSNDHNGSSDSYIYIAIRRGPMKTPTSGASVFSAITATASTGTSRTVGFPADTYLARWKGTISGGYWQDRLRGFEDTSGTTTGKPAFDWPNNTNAESTGGSPASYQIWNTTAKDGGQYSGGSTIWYYLRRAPGFFDVVAYMGTGASTVCSHSLAATPELIIIKRRNAASSNWVVTNAYSGDLTLNQNSGANGSPWSYNITAPTNTQFWPRNGSSNGDVNESGGTFIAYLFASCPGVSKCFNFTGTGTTLQINCGFTNGARFVLIKRTDSTGDWYVWDTARGIIAANDPYLLLNSSAAEVTNTDYINPYAAGFEISSSAPSAINASGGSYIGLAIA